MIHFRAIALILVASLFSGENAAFAQSRRGGGAVCKFTMGASPALRKVTDKIRDALFGPGADPAELKSLIGELSRSPTLSGEMAGYIDFEQPELIQKLSTDERRPEALQQIDQVVKSLENSLRTRTRLNRVSTAIAIGAGTVATGLMIGTLILFEAPSMAEFVRNHPDLADALPVSFYLGGIPAGGAALLRYDAVAGRPLRDLYDLDWATFIHTLTRGELDLLAYRMEPMVVRLSPRDPGRTARNLRDFYKEVRQRISRLSDPVSSSL